MEKLTPKTAISPTLLAKLPDMLSNPKSRVWGLGYLNLSPLSYNLIQTGWPETNEGLC